MTQQYQQYHVFWLFYDTWDLFNKICFVTKPDIALPVKNLASQFDHILNPGSPKQFRVNYKIRGVI